MKLENISLVRIEKQKDGCYSTKFTADIGNITVWVEATFVSYQSASSFADELIEEIETKALGKKV